MTDRKVELSRADKEAIGEHSLGQGFVEVLKRRSAEKREMRLVMDSAAITL